MAEAPAGRSGPLAMITRKVGPLPLWAYAAVLVLAYYLYRRSHPASSSPSGGTPATTDQAYVPPFDAPGIGGGIGATGLPNVTNNYYYGDQAAGQADGGGTSSGRGDTGGGGGDASGGGGGSLVDGSRGGIAYFGPGGGGVYFPPQPSPSASPTIASQIGAGGAPHGQQGMV